MDSEEKALTRALSDLVNIDFLYSRPFDYGLPRTMVAEAISAISRESIQPQGKRMHYCDTDHAFE